MPILCQTEISHSWTVEPWLKKKNPQGRGQVLGKPNSPEGFQGFEIVAQILALAESTNLQAVAQQFFWRFWRSGNRFAHYFKRCDNEVKKSPHCIFHLFCYFATQAPEAGTLPFPPKRIRFNPVAQEHFYFCSEPAQIAKTEAFGKLSQPQFYNFHLVSLPKHESRKAKRPLQC